MRLINKEIYHQLFFQININSISFSQSIMKTTYIVLIALLALTTVHSLPRIEQLALVNSLEVGRDEDPTVWQCAGCSAQNKPIRTHIVQEDVQAVRAIVSIYEDYTVLGFRYTANLKNIWQDLLWAIQVQDQHSCIGCKVQKQYEIMWNSILDQTFDDLKKTQLTNRLIITGISLGGALAQLSFVDIYNQKFFQDIQVITFGSPKVGNSKWADWFNNLTVSQRIYLKGDPIPAFPTCITSICNYKQTERPIVCNKNTKVCQVKNQSQEGFVNPLITAGLVIQGMQEIKDLYISEKLDEEGGILDHIFGYKKIIDYTLKE